MLKHIVLAAFLTCGATGAYAQNQANAPPRSATTPAPAAPAPPATVSTGDFNASGDMAGSASIDDKLHHDAGTTIATIDERHLCHPRAINPAVRPGAVLSGL